VDATAAARTYRIGGIQPYVMLLVLAGCAAFALYLLGHAFSSGSWIELAWVSIVLWLWCSTIWRTAYRIDVAGETVEFRSILWRRRFSLHEIRWIRYGRSGFAVVRLRGSVVPLYGNVDGWDDFLRRVKRMNGAARIFRTR
jgi:hypothetical protein